MCSNLATLRFDKLFDYSAELEDGEAGKVIKSTFERLSREIEHKLEKRNRRRLENGQLTFPYLLPSWLPNGVQT